MAKKKTTEKVPQEGDKGKGTGRPTKRQRRANRPGITMDQYEALLASWVQNRNIRQAARDAGVTRGTATKYIKEGMPEYGMPAIQDQAKQVDAKATEMKQLTLAQFRANYLGQILEALETSQVELRLHRVIAQHKAREAARQEYVIKLGDNGDPLKDANGQPVYETDNHGNLIPVKVYPSIAFDAQVRAHEALTRAGERALGAADETFAETAEENVLAHMTTDEKREYVSSGELPIRLRR
jgi:hypothetical protein